MATENQVKYLMKLAKWKGKDIKEENVKDLDVEEVSQMIDELKAEKSIAKKPADEKRSAAPVGVNGVRFGLACKLLLQESSTKYWIANQEEFNIKAEAVYKLLNKAEEAIRASSGGN